MARKGENIYKRKDNRWEGRYIKDRTPEGKAIYGYVYAKSYTKVKEKQLPLKALYEANKCRIKSFDGTVGDWLLSCLEESRRSGIRSTTYANYCGNIENHLMGVIGSQRLDKITEEDAKKLVRKLQEKGLSGDTIRNIFRLLNSALEQAVSAHIILYNPCKDAKLPKKEAVAVAAMTKKDQGKLMMTAVEHKDTAVRLALETGMRVGELCGLEWENVDLEEGEIRVVQTVVRIPTYKDEGSKTEVIITEPKSKKSKRTIPIDEDLVAYLKARKEESNSDYVVSCKGSFAEPRVVTKRFKKLLEEAGLDSIRFHALRHTYATRCLELNIDIASISKLLGHSSIKMTLDIYADSTMEQRTIAMKKVGKLNAELMAAAVAAATV